MERYIVTAAMLIALRGRLKASLIFVSILVLTLSLETTASAKKIEESKPNSRREETFKIPVSDED